MREAPGAAGCDGGHRHAGRHGGRCSAPRGVDGRASGRARRGAGRAAGMRARPPGAVELARLWDAARVGRRACERDGPDPADSRSVAAGGSDAPSVSFLSRFVPEEGGRDPARRRRVEIRLGPTYDADGQADGRFRRAGGVEGRAVQGRPGRHAAGSGRTPADESTTHAPGKPAAHAQTGTRLDGLRGNRGCRHPRPTAGPPAGLVRCRLRPRGVGRRRFRIRRFRSRAFAWTRKMAFFLLPSPWEAVTPRRRRAG